ncbi:MAG: prepilin-type N-terminal cleavage/methylation domain-containing protein [Endomicrobium sp.]|jgi:hypothetical protein|nr:prepilin-type N-terminal cleavage/methylation domain-containing protein [Endomicrobium sp.]
MNKVRGQTLLEFILVFAVLLIVTSGIVSLYSNFWKSKYKKISTLSGLTSSALKVSKYKVSYVK